MEHEVESIWLLREVFKVRASGTDFSPVKISKNLRMVNESKVVEACHSTLACANIDTVVKQSFAKQANQKKLTFVTTANIIIENKHRKA